MLTTLKASYESIKFVLENKKQCEGNLTDSF